MTDHMERGKKQVMYKFPPKATFSNPKHDLIEISENMQGDPIDLTSEQEIIDYVHAKLDNWDGGYEGGKLPAPDRRNWAIADPEGVYSTIFPLVFECIGCGKVHDYSENRIGQLEENGLECQRSGCDGELTQIHHVGVCPSCSDISSIDVPGCDQHGWDYIILDDQADRYQDFKWRCGICNSVVRDNIDTYCECGTKMEVTVHSASKAMNIHDFTRVDLGTNNIYNESTFSDESIDPLVIGAYLQEFDHPETTLREMVEQEGISSIDVDQIDVDDPDAIEAAKQMIGQIGDGAEDPELVRHSVQQKVGNANPAENMRRYIQLHEIMEQESAREDSNAKEQQLLDKMGILDIGITSEFPLLGGVYGYHRTFNEQEDDKETPAVRSFPSIRVEHNDYRTPIYVTRSETEAAIVQLDPREVGHWLVEAGFDIEDTIDMDIPEARAVLYAEMEPVEHYSTEIGDEDSYNNITRAVHRLLHTISHLLMQRASVHSGIEETSFAEYLFTEALATAIYSNNTQNYTAGGLFTLVDRNLDDWLLSTLNEGERCMYDPTCAEIRDGSCHACMHMSEISCQHYNKNLSRVDLYGQRIAKDVPPGFWKLTGGLGS